MAGMKNDLGEVVIYRAKDGKTTLDVQLAGDTVWLTQAQMAKLFENTKQNISLHTRNIFREGELSEKAVVKESLTTAPDGKKYNTKYFNLDVIISVGYRVKSNDHEYACRGKELTAPARQAKAAGERLQ